MTGSGSQCSRWREGEDGVTCEAGRTCRGVQCAVPVFDLRGGQRVAKPLQTSYTANECRAPQKSLKNIQKQQAARGIISNIDQF